MKSHEAAQFLGGMVLKQRQKEEKKEALLSVYALCVYQMAGDRTLC